jgi:hypothetical protein
MVQRRPRAERQSRQVHAEHGQSEHVAERPLPASANAGGEIGRIAGGTGALGCLGGVDRNRTCNVGHGSVSRSLGGAAEPSPAPMRAQEFRIRDCGCCLICTIIHVDFDASSPPCVVCDPASKCPDHHLPVTASQHLSQQRICLEGTI